MEDTDFIGRTVDHYNIIALVRGGAQGRVYRGRDEVLLREVAIKVLNYGCPLGGEARHDLIAEARVLSSLNHPNVAGVYDFRHARISATSWSWNSLPAPRSRKCLPADRCHSRR